MGELRRSGEIVTIVEGESAAQAAGEAALKGLQGSGRSLQDVTTTLREITSKLSEIANGLGAL